MPKHDNYFKTLLQNHFKEFIEFTFPEIYQEIDFDGFSHEDFLNQEQLAEIDGRLHRLDAVARVKLKDQPHFNSVYAIIFVEAQHKRTKEFPERIFRYFCLLYLKYRVLILPIALYSDKALWRHPEDWNSFKIQFNTAPIVAFNFFTYKPSLHNIKNYLRSKNPATLALASLMKLGEEDLIQSKLQLIRQLNKLNIPESQSLDLFKFIDHYLATSGEDIQKEVDLFKDEPQEENGMLVEHFTNEGIKIGIEKGREEGREQNNLEIVHRMLENKLPWEDITKFTGLSESEYKSAVKSKTSD